MRIAVYGGSFNPPHVGHAMVASWLLWTGRVDRVLLVPAFSHPFGKELATYPARVRMCEAMCLGIPGASVSTIESELPVPSYSIDTLEALQAQLPEAQLHMVVGADVLEDLPRWRRWPEIEARFAPIKVGRQGWPTPTGAIDFPGVSSTEIRRRLGSGEQVAHLLPASVLCELGGLYR